jgi:hypothetical protein
MAVDERCPCDAVTELRTIVSSHEKSINGSEVKHAVTMTQLGTLNKILGVIGIALVGLCIRLLFMPGVVQ